MADDNLSAYPTPDTDIVILDVTKLDPLLGAWREEAHPGDDIVYMCLDGRTVLEGTIAQHREFLGRYGLVIGATEHELIQERVQRGRTTFQERLRGEGGRGL